MLFLFTIWLKLTHHIIVKISYDINMDKYAAKSYNCMGAIAFFVCGE